MAIFINIKFSNLSVTLIAFIAEILVEKSNITIWSELILNHTGIALLLVFLNENSKKMPMVLLRLIIYKLPYAKPVTFL